MNAKRVALWCLSALALCTGGLQADNLAFGVVVTDFGIIDLNTGIFTKTGSTTLGGTPMALSGLVELGGTLYGADFGQTSSNLYTVNTTNGALSVVGSASVTYDDFGSTPTGGLFAVGSDANLYSINATT